MSSATKSNPKSVQVSQNEEEFSSKKHKLHPHPEDEDLEKSAHSKKLKTGNKSVSKSKISTTKKSEVTFSEKVEEIKDSQQDKENDASSLTPFKAKSPSHASLKSVKEHQKTPYSKLKENNEEVSKKSLHSSQSPSTKTNQPNFNKEIMDASVTMSSAKKSSGRGRDITPTKSARKYEGRSRSKSPLTKIREVREEHIPEKENSQEAAKEEKHEQEKFSDDSNKEAQLETEENKNDTHSTSKKKISQSNHKESSSEEEKNIAMPTSEKKSIKASAGKKTPAASAEKNPFMPENKSALKSPVASAGKKSLSQKAPLSEKKENANNHNEEEEIGETVSQHEN